MVVIYEVRFSFLEGGPYTFLSDTLERAIRHAELYLDTTLAYRVVIRRLKVGNGATILRTYVLKDDAPF